MHPQHSNHMMHNDTHRTKQHRWTKRGNRTAIGTQIGSTKEGRSSSDPFGTASTTTNHDVIQYKTATTLLTDQQELRSDRQTSDPIGDCYGRSNLRPTHRRIQRRLLVYLQPIIGTEKTHPLRSDRRTAQHMSHGDIHNNNMVNGLFATNNPY